MRRREFIALLASLPVSGTAVLCSNLVSFGRSRINEHTAQTVAAIADLMFPGDGLAGATNQVASLRCRVWIGVLTSKARRGIGKQSNSGPQIISAERPDLGVITV